jgi:hypothetical protein
VEQAGHAIIIIYDISHGDAAPDKAGANKASGQHPFFHMD